MTTGSNTSTRLRSVAAAEANSAAHFHRVRWGLAYKFALPVAILQAVVLVSWGLVVLREVRDNQLNETVKSGLTTVKLVAERGEVLIGERNGYRRRHPEYADERAAFSADFGDHWLLSAGQIRPERWSRLTGVPVGDPVSKAQMGRAEQNAALLGSLTRQGASDSEVLAAYVVAYNEDRLNPDRPFHIAATEPINQRPSITEADWMGLGRDSTALERVRIGPRVEPTAPVRVTQATLSWDDAPTRPAANVLQFYQPIYPPPQPGVVPRPMGAAIVALRADVIQHLRQTTANLMFIAGAVAVSLATALCFFVASRVTTPIRRLLADMDVFSAGEMDHRTSAYSQDEIGLVAAEFNRMAGRLEQALGREKEAARLNTELDTAREIQTSLLPQQVPFVRGFDLAVCYRPAREVGGDYYDFFPIDSSHLGIVVADVSGKSIPGALVMSTTRTILRFVVPGNLSAADTLRRTNAVVAQDIRRGMFVSAFYLILDVSHHRAMCASAGHNPLVVCRADGTIQTISPGGIALGFDKGPIFNRTIKEAPLLLSSGDRVVMYTDGVVEAMNQKNEEYGDERFLEFVRNSLEMTSREFVAALLADLDAHQGAAEQHDDITLVTFRVE